MSQPTRVPPNPAERAINAMNDARAEAMRRADTWPIDGPMWEAAWKACLEWAEQDLRLDSEELIICCDCGREATPNCEYAGHGTSTLADLVDSYSNPPAS